MRRCGGGGGATDSSVTVYSLTLFSTVPLVCCAQARLARSAGTSRGDGLDLIGSVPVLTYISAAVYDYLANKAKICVEYLDNGDISTSTTWMAAGRFEVLVGEPVALDGTRLTVTGIEMQRLGRSILVHDVQYNTIFARDPFRVSRPNLARISATDEEEKKLDALHKARTEATDIDEIAKVLTKPLILRFLAAYAAHVRSEQPGDPPKPSAALRAAVLLSQREYTPVKSGKKMLLARALSLWRVQHEKLCATVDADRTTFDSVQAQVLAVAAQLPTAQMRRAAARDANRRAFTILPTLPKRRPHRLQRRGMSASEARSTILATERAKLIAAARGAEHPEQFLTEKKLLQAAACTRLKDKVKPRQLAAARGSSLALLELRLAVRRAITSIARRCQRKVARESRWTQMQRCRALRRATADRFIARRAERAKSVPPGSHWLQQPPPRPPPGNVGRAWAWARAHSRRTVPQYTPGPLDLPVPSSPPLQTLHPLASWADKTADDATAAATAATAAAATPAAPADRPAAPPAPAEPPAAPPAPTAPTAPTAPAASSASASRRGPSAIDVTRCFLTEIGKASRRAHLTPTQITELHSRLDDAGFTEFTPPLALDDTGFTSTAPPLGEGARATALAAEKTAALIAAATARR